MRIWQSGRKPQPGIEMEAPRIKMLQAALGLTVFELPWEII